MTLTKAHIISVVQSDLDFTKKEATQIVETLLEIMKRNMEKGEDILISGFGKFCVRTKRERRGRNPATGEALTLSKRRVVTFKCSGKLREKVNQKVK